MTSADTQRLVTILYRITGILTCFYALCQLTLDASAFFGTRGMAQAQDARFRSFSGSDAGFTEWVHDTNLWSALGLGGVILLGVALAISAPLLSRWTTLDRDV